jgi:hypothetical protein
MTQFDPVGLFGSEEVWHAMEGFERPPVSAGGSGDGLTGPAASRDRAGGLVPVVGPGGAWYAVPVAAEPALRAAVWSAAAARRLLAGQVVTVGVLGRGLAGQLMLAGVVRYVPGVSHVSLYGGSGHVRIEPRVVDGLDLAGVGFVVAGTAGEAVRGANLVIVCDDTGADLRIERLSPHCVLVNAGGVDLPDELVDQVDAIYVDDTRLLGTHRHRYFVRAHAAAVPAPARGRCTLGGPAAHRVRVLGDFRRLRTGRRRPHAEQIVLVELLGDDLTTTPATPEFTPMNPEFIPVSTVLPGPISGYQ